MNQNGLFVLRDMVYGLLQECTQKRDLAAARQVHLCMISHGLDSVAVLGDHLIRLFASSSGSLLEANQVFCKVSKPSVFTWNAIILAHTVFGEGEMALDLYHKMQQKGIESNNATYTCALKASSCIGVVGQGRLLHQQIVENGVELDLVVGNALVDMYAKCSSLNEAHNVFNNLPNRSVVSWGAMFAGYAQQGDGWGALKLFNKMQQDAVEPNGFIYSCMLKGCCNIGVVEQGRLIHEKVISSGLDLDVVVGSSLIDMYAKCSSLEDAYKTFRALPNKNVVSWGAIITGFVDHGHGLPALELFVEMQGMGIKPNRVIFLCVLQACGGIGVVRLGRLLHDQIVKVGLQNELTIGSVLVEMYAKCGNLGDALRVFDRLPSPNPVAWGMLIAGYTEHGKCSTAGQYLEGMQQQGVQPSDLMYTSLLSAYCHAGSFEEGFHSFKCMMESHGIAPSIEHYNCLVDLLGRAGHLEESEYLLKTMPVLPDIVGWMALLMNCCSHGNMKLAKHSFNQAVQLRPDHASSYVLMSNVYGDALRWQDVYNAHS